MIVGVAGILLLGLLSCRDGRAAWLRWGVDGGVVAGLADLLDFRGLLLGRKERAVRQVRGLCLQPHQFFFMIFWAILYIRTITLWGFFFEKLYEDFSLKINKKREFFI
jgi:hypothetical protein